MLAGATNMFTISFGLVKLQSGSERKLAGVD